MTSRFLIRKKLQRDLAAGHWTIYDLCEALGIVAPFAAINPPWDAIIDAYLTLRG